VSSGVAGATALATLLAAVLGVLKYFNYRTKRDRQAAVGQAFVEVIRGLGTSDPVQRLASAILLCRFFDTHSEYFVRGLPYGTDAVRELLAYYVRNRQAMCRRCWPTDWHMRPRSSPYERTARTAVCLTSLDNLRSWSSSI
jgi:hypothetical protein